MKSVGVFNQSIARIFLYLCVYVFVRALTSAISSSISTSRTTAARTSRAIPHPGTPPPPPEAGGVVLGVVLLDDSFGETETDELLAVVVPVLVAMEPVVGVMEPVAACAVFAVPVVVVTELFVVWCSVLFGEVVVMVTLGIVVVLWGPCVAAAVLVVGLGPDWVTPGPVVAFTWGSGDADMWSDVELVSLLVELTE